VVTGEQDARRAARELAAAMQQLHDSIDLVARAATRVAEVRAEITSDPEWAKGIENATRLAFYQLGHSYLQLVRAMDS